MKKYAILIAAFMVIQGAARADHLRSNWSDSRPGAACWCGKADSSVRGAITPYATQHMAIEPNVMVISEDQRIRADSSQRGARMPQQTWENRLSDTSYSSDLQFQGEQGVAIDLEPWFEPDVQLPAQGTPGDNVQSETQSSDLFDAPTRLDESDIDSDYHPQYDSSKSNDYRSERSQSDLNAPGNDTQLRQQSPEQGAPATTPETGRGSEFDRSSSRLQGEATLQNNEQSIEPSDLKSAQDYYDSAIKETGAAGVRSPDSVDTTVRPPLPENPTDLSSTEDPSFSERIRMHLTSGNEGRPGAFTATSLEDVKINSHAGIVTLEGRVGSDQEKRDLESRVKEMPGVLSVHNMLEVTGGSTSKFTPPD